MSAAPFHPSRSGRGSNSERCPAAQLELLHAVKLTFGKRNGIIEAQRAERRRPDQTDTHGSAHDITAVERQSRTAPRKRRIDLRIRWGAVRVCWRGEFVGQG